MPKLINSHGSLIAHMQVKSLTYIAISWRAGCKLTFCQGREQLSAVGHGLSLILGFYRLVLL